MNDGVWKSSSPRRPGQSAGPTICALPVGRVDVHVAAITHTTAGSPALVLTLPLRHRPSPVAVIRL
jgi:hypothetical protein